MISVKINNIKDFTTKLLAKETFDEWLLVEGIIKTHSLFHISGELNPGFFSPEELKENGLNRYNPWKFLRPVCYEMVRGKHLPTSFKFILRLNDNDVHTLLLSQPDYHPSDVDGMDLNIRYDNGILTLTTGLSLKIFTLDKSLEKALDTYLLTFLEKQQISYL